MLVCDPVTVAEELSGAVFALVNFLVLGAVGRVDVLVQGLGVAELLATRACGVQEEKSLVGMIVS